MGSDGAHVMTDGRGCDGCACANDGENDDDDGGEDDTLKFKGALSLSMMAPPTCEFGDTLCTCGGLSLWMLPQEGEFSGGDPRCLAKCAI